MKRRSDSSVLHFKGSKKRANEDDMEGMNCRKDNGQLNSLEKGMQKKSNNNTTDDTTDTCSLPLSSDSGLDEVELSQSGDENGEYESKRAQSTSRAELHKDVESITGPNSAVENMERSTHHDNNFVPLSIRRSERSRYRSAETLVRSETRENNSVVTPQLLRNGSTSPNAEDRDISLAPINNTELFARNEIKAEVLELKRDKRAYSSALLALREKSEQMTKDLLMKDQQIMVLEEALSRKKGNRNGGKGLAWSLENLSKHGIARYQGICFAAGKYGTQLAKQIVTESFIDENDDGNQRQDWSSSAIKASADTAGKAKVYVKLPDGVSAIPICSMVRALQKEFYTSKVGGAVGLLKVSFNNVLNGPVGTYLTEAERDECLSRVAVHRPTIQKFRTIISDVVGNRKKSARNTYLKSLGYRYASLPDSKKDTSVVKELRTRDKESVLRRCVNPDNEYDTSYWRTSGWESLCVTGASTEIEEDLKNAEEDVEKDGKVDNLFMNEAARRAFLVLRGFSVSSSIASVKPENED